MMEKFLDRKNLSKDVYEHILNMILNLDFKSGEKISEEKIAAMLGVSRTPIREALRKLNEDGLVNIYPRRFAEVVTFDDDMIRNIGLTRISLDKLAVELVILYGSDADYEKLENLARSCLEKAEAGDKFNSIKSDSELHLEIARLSKNRVLYEILDGIHMKVRLIQMNAHNTDKELTKSIEQHIPLIEAIKKRDADLAVSLAQEHLVKFYGLQNNPVIRRI